MMHTTKRFLTVLSLAGAALIAAPAALAQAAAPTKILSIRSAEILQQSPQLKSFVDRMKKEFEQRGKDLEAEGRRLEEEFAQFRKDSAVLSATDYAKRKKELDSRRSDFEAKGRQLQEDMGMRERQLRAEMMSKIQSVIVQIAKERGADLVVQDPAFATDVVDVTGEVIKRLQGAAAK